MNSGSSNVFYLVARRIKKPDSKELWREIKVTIRLKLTEVNTMPIELVILFLEIFIIISIWVKK